MIRGDAGWLSEAIQNILKNCIEGAGDHGKIHIMCEDTPLFTGITLHDSGAGFDKEDLPVLFEGSIGEKILVRLVMGSGWHSARPLSPDRAEPLPLKIILRAARYFLSVFQSDGSLTGKSLKCKREVLLYE